MNAPKTLWAHCSPTCPMKPWDSYMLIETMWYSYLRTETPWYSYIHTEPTWLTYMHHASYLHTQTAGYNYQQTKTPGSDMVWPAHWDPGTLSCTLRPHGTDTCTRRPQVSYMHTEILGFLPAYWYPMVLPPEHWDPVTPWYSYLHIETLWPHGTPNCILRPWNSYPHTGTPWDFWLHTGTLRYSPTDTLHNNEVVITPKQWHFDVITLKWRRFDVVTTFSLRHVFGGSYLHIGTLWYLYLPTGTLWYSYLHTGAPWYS